MRIFALIVTTFVLSAAAFWGSLPARATVLGVYPGDLIKLQNDNDPGTHEDEVVYYFDKDWFRHPFPNRKVYLSWYNDFSGVKELTREQLAEIRLGGNVVYRPGTRLIKIPSVPKVYAVEPAGMLRWIESEAVAKALFGADWAQRVDDVSESFFVNYKEGAPLVAPVWPTGTVVRRTADDTLFYIDGMTKRHLKPADAAVYRLSDASVITTSSHLDEYANAADLDPRERRYVDTAQVEYNETLPPPQIDFPVSAGSLRAGQEQALYSFRLTAGQPVIIKRLRATLTGPLWSGSTPQLTDLKFVDVNGENLFGTKQLETPNAGTETLEWSGAYTMLANTTSIIELRAKLSAGWSAGSKLTVSLDRDRVSLYDGKSGQAIPDFYPRAAFPAVTLTVE